MGEGRIERLDDSCEPLAWLLQAVLRLKPSASGRTGVTTVIGS